MRQAGIGNEGERGVAGSRNRDGVWNAVARIAESHLADAIEELAGHRHRVGRGRGDLTAGRLHPQYLRRLHRLRINPAAQHRQGEAGRLLRLHQHHRHLERKGRPVIGL